MSLSEAFQIAGDETAARGIDGSPSPAPRSWRKNAGAAEGSRLRQTLNESGKSPAARLAERNAAAQRTRSEDRLSDVGAANRSFGDDIEGLPKLVPGIDELPTRRSPTRSPEKSYAWEIDDDFTAGDLQVSNSPMIRVANTSKNSKLAEIQQLEKDHTGEISGLSMPSSARQAISRKVDDIIAKQNTPTPQKKWLASGRAKIDEVQQLEKEGLSRRQYAAARLEEIKEQNGMRRSFSPGEQAARRQQDLAAATGSSPGSASKSRSTWRAAQSSLSPPRSDRNVSSEGHRDLLRQLARGTSASPHADNRAAQTTAEDGVTSTSPDSKRNLGSKNDIRAGSLRRTSDNDTRRVSGGSSTSSTHPARQVVGFTGLWGGKSRSSSGSSKSKRSSMNSEPDPTARLDSEMKLFAPADNYSERGSQRAPSPMPEDDEESDRAADATPKPTKPDPLSMPTPQIVGAYVETPVTARAARQAQPRSRSKLREAQSATTDMENVFLDKPKDEESPSKRVLSREDTIRATRDTKPARQTRPKSQSRSRSRSASRPRPPLRNTAALPTARQDLLELQAMHDMDDATIDDLERIFAANKELTAGEILKVVQDLPATEDELDDIVKRERGIQVKREASVEAAFEKMNKDMAKAMPNVDKEVASLRESVQAEKATRKVSAEKAAQVKIEESSPKPTFEKPQKVPKPTDEHEHHHHKHVLSQECPLCVAAPKQGSIIAYIHFPIPRFYHRQPNFRLTLLGLLVTVLSVWYAVESAACAKYCRPQICTPNAPCVWSFDDPTFGYAMPVKADQWITGGRGRAVANHLVEEARDWMADLADAALGRSIQNVDTSNMSFEAKRRHRRRMGKKGLLTPPREPSPETKAKWEGWKRERVARENQRNYYEETEAIGEDERIW